MFKKVIFLPLLLVFLITGCVEKVETDEDNIELAESMPAIRDSLFVENARIPTVAIDSKTGKMYVAFFQHDGDRNHVYVMHRSPGEKDWSNPVRISDEADDASPHAQAPAQVVVGPEGNVYVVWTNAIPIEGRRFPASNLLFSRSLDGGLTFSTQTAINSDAEGFPASHTFHDVTAGKDGTIFVSWLDSREKYRTMSQHDVDMPVHQASLHSHQTTSVQEDPGTQVWVASSTDQGLSFSEGTVVASGTCQCCRTSIIAPDDDLIVAWRHVFPGTERDMALAFSDDGGNTFSEPERIFADNWSLEGCPHSGPSMTIDASGRIHAAWYTGKTSGPGLYYSISDDGITFNRPVPLVTDVGVSQVRLSGLGTERSWIAWEDRQAKGVQLAFIGRDAAFKMLTFLSSASNPSLFANEEYWILAVQEKEGIRLLQGNS